jgi:hypothetical protein
MRSVHARCVHRNEISINIIAGVKHGIASVKHFFISLMASISRFDLGAAIEASSVTRPCLCKMKDNEIERWRALLWHAKNLSLL